jgi:sterol 14-demethylase
VDLKEELAKLIIMTASRTLLGREVREQMFEQVRTFLLVDM